jgi:sulfur-carrier protein
MSVTFHIPGPLRSFANGRSQVEVAGTPATLSEALQSLWVVCPGIRDRVVTEQGLIRQHINIFVGKEDVRYTGGLATPVAPGAEITIVPSVSGGKGDAVARASRPRSRERRALARGQSLS